MVLFYLPLRMLKSALVREQVVEDALYYLDFLNRIREVVFQKMEVEMGARSMKLSSKSVWETHVSSFLLGVFSN